MAIPILILSVGILAMVLGYFVKNRIGAFGCLITGVLLIWYSISSMITYEEAQRSMEVESQSGFTCEY